LTGLLLRLPAGLPFTRFALFELVVEFLVLLEPDVLALLRLELDAAIAFGLVGAALLVHLAPAFGLGLAFLLTAGALLFLLRVAGVLLLLLTGVLLLLAGLFGLIVHGGLLSFREVAG